MDCEVVWHASQQLCNAESLTGKPCIHQVHEVVNFCVGPEFGRKSAKVGSIIIQVAKVVAFGTFQRSTNDAH